MAITERLAATSSSSDTSVASSVDEKVFDRNRSPIVRRGPAYNFLGASLEMASSRPARISCRSARWALFPDHRGHGLSAPSRAFRRQRNLVRTVGAGPGASSRATRDVDSRPHQRGAGVQPGTLRRAASSDRGTPPSAQHHRLHLPEPPASQRLRGKAWTRRPQILAARLFPQGRGHRREYAARQGGFRRIVRSRRLCAPGRRRGSRFQLSQCRGSLASRPVVPLAAGHRARLPRLISFTASDPPTPKATRSTSMRRRRNSWRRSDISSRISASISRRSRCGSTSCR